VIHPTECVIKEPEVPLKRGCGIDIKWRPDLSSNIAERHVLRM